jgi:hypothetical protein
MQQLYLQVTTDEFAGFENPNSRAGLPIQRLDRSAFVAGGTVLSRVNKALGNNS